MGVWGTRTCARRVIGFVAATTAAIGLTVAVPPSGPGPVTASAATAGSLTSSPRQVIAGEVLRLTGRLRTPLARPVALQRHRGASWVVLAHAVSDSRGRFAFRVHGRTSSTTYRVIAPRTTIRHHVHGFTVTPTRRVATVAQSARLAAPGTVVTGQRFSISSTLRPTRVGRPVHLQRRSGRTWRTIATASERTGGTVVFSRSQPSVGVVTYRTVATSFRGAPAAASGPRTVEVEATAAGRRFLTRASSNGRYFLDQHGAPIMLRGDTVWGLLTNAGLATGSWKSDIDRYVAARASEGFNTVYVAALGYPWTPAGGKYPSGATWDGVPPWVGGSTGSVGPNVGTLNPAYWQRVDYLLSSARSAGLTVMLDIIHSDNIGGNGHHDGALFPQGTFPTDAQMTTYGRMLGHRYRSYHNLIWMIGGDYFGDADAKIALTLKAIRKAGATQMTSVEYFDHSTSRATSLGRSFANWSVVYTYAPTYTQCEKAWRSTPAIPEVWTDGYYDQDSGAGNNLLYRQQQGWALTSGSQGSMYAEEGLWDWNDGSLKLAQHPDAVARGIVRVWNALSALRGWSRLVPDIDSTTLLTGDRGTKITSDAAYSDPTNDYVTGSITPDGTLALIYLPRGGTAHVTWAHMSGSGRSAKWLDPTTGALHAVTPGRTAYPTPGANAAGQPDWYLVLQAS